MLHLEKAGHFPPGFFFVDKRFEIFNLDLIRDMDKIIEMEKVFSKIK